MTPQQEKAKELVMKFVPLAECGDNRYTTKIQISNAKQCAIIACDEVIEWNHKHFDGDASVYYAQLNELESIKQAINEL